MNGSGAGNALKVSPKQGENGARKQGIENKILLQLPRREFNAIIPQLKWAELLSRTILSEAGKPVDQCYFLNSGMISIVHVMTDGRSIEVGLTGKEGFIGLPVIVGFQTSPTRAIVQVSGTGYSISVDQFKKALQTCPSLMTLLQRYSQELAVQSTQIAACNRLHAVDQQLARWLLMTEDRVGKNDFPLTQEFISHMLGTRRASVSVAAGSLQKKGLITYTRGQVSIKDRPGLEKASCECYEEINRQLESWKTD